MILFRISFESGLDIGANRDNFQIVSTGIGAQFIQKGFRHAPAPKLSLHPGVSGGKDIALSGLIFNFTHGAAVGVAGYESALFGFVSDVHRILLWGLANRQPYRSAHRPLRRFAASFCNWT